MLCLLILTIDMPCPSSGVHPNNSLALPHHSLVLFHSLLLLYSSSLLLHNCLAFLDSRHLAYSHLLIIDKVNPSLRLVIVIHTSPY